MSDSAALVIRVVALACIPAAWLPVGARAQSAADKLRFPAPEYADLGIGGAPRLGDFDGDGKLDAVRRQYAVGVEFARGHGDGTFETALLTPMPSSGESWLEMADLDGDGVLDVVLAGGGFVNPTISVGLGQGDGSFVPLPTLAIADSAFGAELGDVDGDGELDLLAATYPASSSGSNEVAVLLGVGNGSFTIAPYVTAGALLEDIDAADFDEDGELDFAVVDRWNGVAKVFRGQGTGAFVAGAVVSVGPYPSAIVVGDWNGDTHTDFATSGNPPVSAHLGDGTGAFTSTGPVPFQPYNSLDLTSVDFDQDGLDDLIVGDAHAAPWVARGGGGGAWTALERHLGTSGSVDAGDVNGDGRVDLCWTALGLAVALGGPQDTLIAAPYEALVTGTASFDYPAPLTPIVADYDLDGHLDLAVTSRGMLNVLAGDGSGALELASTLTIMSTGGITCRLVAQGDVDGDGDPDLVASDGGGARLLRNAGAGQFSPATLLPFGGDVRRGEFADLDQDGDLDLLLPAKVSQIVSVALGNGNGSFQPPSVIAAGGPFLRAHVGDLDGDGDSDVAACVNLQFQGLFVAHGQGDGSFLPQVMVPQPFVGDVVLLDLNEDGDVDAALGGSDWSAALAMFGDGSGALGTPTALVSGGHETLLEFADLDGDGDVDLIGGDVSVRMGTGALPFGSPAYFSGSGAVRAGDFDEDGRSDLVVCEAAYAPVAAHAGVLLNQEQMPFIGSVSGLAAAATGTAVVEGAGFDASTQVSVGGMPVPSIPLGPMQLALSLGPSVPGYSDIDLVGVFGSVSAPNGLQRWPALDSGPAQIGMPLSLALSNGGPGLYALAVSGSLLPGPIPIPGIYHGVWLNPVVLLKVGVIAVGQTSAAHAVFVPPDPGLSGASLYFQAWAQQDGQPVVPATSFSNHHRVTIQ